MFSSIGYSVAAANTSCPEDDIIRTAGECQAAAKALSLRYNIAETTNNLQPIRPAGCYTMLRAGFIQDIFFNTINTGTLVSPAEDSAGVCSRSSKLL